MTRKAKYNVLSVIAFLSCVAPPFITTLCQFPVWVQDEKAAISGIALLCIFFSCLPFIKQIRAYFKSPSATVVWIIVFVLLFLMKHIINEMMYVAVAGLAGNCAGEIFFMWRKRYKEE